MSRRENSKLNEVCNQGIEDVQERKLDKFIFRMLTLAEIFEELFTCTLNGVAVTVWYVSSTSAVLHAGLNHQLRHRKRII